MTIDELGLKVEELEGRIKEIEEFVRAARSARIADTFGMFANDIGFEEIAELGREYRNEANELDCERPS